MVLFKVGRWGTGAGGLRLIPILTGPTDYNRDGYDVYGNDYLTRNALWRLFDNDESTYASLAASIQQYYSAGIIVRLRNAVLPKSVQVKPYGEIPYGTYLQIQGSNDGVEWANLNARAEFSSDVIDLSSVNTAYKYYQILVDNYQGHNDMSLCEIAFYKREV